jgi:hypothetical protein
VKGVIAIKWMPVVAELGRRAERERTGGQRDIVAGVALAFAFLGGMF